MSDYLPCLQHCNSVYVGVLGTEPSGLSGYQMFPLISRLYRCTGRDCITYLTVVCCKMRVLGATWFTENVSLAWYAVDGC